MTKSSKKGWKTKVIPGADPKPIVRWELPEIKLK